MKFGSIGISSSSLSDSSMNLAQSVLCNEINRRFTFSGEGGDCRIYFNLDKSLAKDDFVIDINSDGIKFTASGIRGFIYCIGMFLRKTVPCDGGFETVCDFSGNYTPFKPVRGHQSGYRAMNNSYDMWDISQFSSYFVDMMYFGANTVELAKAEPEDVEYMKYSDLELLKLASQQADAIDMDFSVWACNYEDNIEDAVANRRELFEALPRLDYFFTPGADPGDLPADELFRWLKAFEKELKNIHPGAKMTPSAQMPRDVPGWGEDFVKGIKDNPGLVDYVVQGPNRAFTTEELRRKIPAEYEVRFYPDITHNVRCETPVHFQQDDWHYSWTSAYSRESINPRPCEYKKYHFLNSQYSNGSVAYSEGINDDINKAVWSALEWDPSLSIREILEDYARLYLPGTDSAKVCDAIIGLENNWLTEPALATGAEYTYMLWKSFAENKADLGENWRYLSGLFRATGDLYIRKKVLFETPLCDKAVKLIKQGKTAEAKRILQESAYPEDIMKLRAEIEVIASKLYELICFQLSVEKYNATGWERGAVLDTIDNPVTDRAYLINMLEMAEKSENGAKLLASVLEMTDKKPGEFSWFLAFDGLDMLGEPQTPDFYMDFQGDCPRTNNGRLPMCLTKLFDHYEFRARIGGLTSGKDYTMTVIYGNSPRETDKFKITLDGKLFHEGSMFGGEKNEEISAIIPSDYWAIDYTVPAEYFENGCVRLVITEPKTGFEVAAVKFKEKK